MSLTEHEIDLIRGSFRVIAADAQRAGELFYEMLFEAAPGVRPMFPASLSDQAGKLSSTLGLVVAQLSNWDKLAPVVERLGVRHVAYGVEPEHYDLVGKVLLAMMAKVLEEDFDDETRAAWTKAYGALASTMIAAAGNRDAA